MLLTLTPALADDYTINVSTNPTQEAIVVRIYVRECRRMVASGEAPPPGLDATCMGTPTHGGKTAMLRQLLIAEVQDVRRTMLREQAEELRRVFENLTEAQQDAIKSQAGIP